MKKIYFVVALCLGLTGCGENHSRQHDAHNHQQENHDHNTEEEHDHADGEDHRHEEETDNDHENEIILTAEQAEAAGLQTKKVTPGPISQVIKTTGQIQPAPGDETTLVATTSGIIRFGQSGITEGAPIRTGQVIFTISSDKLPEGDPAIKARINYETAKKEYERMQSLVKDKIVSEKEFDLSFQNYETARIAYEAVAGQQGKSGRNIVSPMNGFIKNRLVGEGDFVQTGQPLMTIAQNQKLILRAEVSEKYYDILPLIRSANFKTPYDNRLYELTRLHGKLRSVGKTSGTGSFYIPVTFEFDNKGNMIPGAYVEVYLLSAPVSETLTIPVSALSEEQGLYFVYLKTGEDVYRKQEVTTGISNGKDIQIRTGLNAGDILVTQGANRVKLAANSGIIPEGHSHNH